MPFSAVTSRLNVSVRSESVCANSLRMSSISSRAARNASVLANCSDSPSASITLCTRYEGAINLAGLSGLDFANIAVSQIQMRVTFGPAGGDSTKYLTFYKATKNSISGSIASTPGACPAERATSRTESV